MTSYSDSVVGTSFSGSAGFGCSGAGASGLGSGVGSSGSGFSGSGVGAGSSSGSGTGVGCSSSSSSIGSVVGVSTSSEGSGVGVSTSSSEFGIGSSPVLESIAGASKASCSLLINVSSVLEFNCFSGETFFAALLVSFSVVIGVPSFASTFGAGLTWVTLVSATSAFAEESKVIEPLVDVFSLTA
ncbi:hypothetical protein RV10_GL004743 [Enterococcus pallens]|nr:hypothetical protein RV10_GL004743 [Enterococcus pallens]